MKKQCKPCITIRDILKIIWINSKLFVRNTKRDIQSYSMMHATVCTLDSGNYGPIPPTNLMKAIKQLAQENYNAENAQKLLDEAKNNVERESINAGTKSKSQEKTDL